MSDYIEDSLVFPVSSSAMIHEPGHRILMSKKSGGIQIPYLNAIDGRILEAADGGCRKYIVAADRITTARKTAVYINSVLKNDVTIKLYYDEDYDEPLNDEEDDVAEDSADEEADDLSEDADAFGEGDEDRDDPGKEEEGPDLSEREPDCVYTLSALEEVNLKTFSDEERRQGRTYIVRSYAKDRTAGVLVTGLQDGLELEEKLDAVKTFDGEIFLWIPKALLNDKNIYELELLSGFGRIEVEEPDDSYYASLLSNLAEKAGAEFSAGLSELDIVLRLKKKLADKFSEECVASALKRALERAGKRSGEGAELLMVDFFPEFRAGDSAIEQLERMTGLKNVKSVVKQHIALSREKVRNKALRKADIYGSMILCGNPGTGKTTVSKLLAQAMCECGASSGAFVSVTREDLVGKYVGHTAGKVADAFKRAEGGVLFVDEAGFFLNRDSGGFVSEALKEFVRFMEIMPNVTVIFAMYSSEAKDFLELDSGLRSRVSQVVEFNDYTGEEIKKIAAYMFKERGYKLQKGVTDIVAEQIDSLRSGNDFGNARDVRRIVDAAISAHAMRIQLGEGRRTCDPDLITVPDAKSGIEIASRVPKDDAPKRPIGFRIPQVF